MITEYRGGIYKIAAENVVEQHVLRIFTELCRGLEAAPQLHSVSSDQQLPSPAHSGEQSKPESNHPEAGSKLGEAHHQQPNRLPE